MTRPSPRPRRPEAGPGAWPESAPRSDITRLKEALRRRIYLGALALGLPVLLVLWLVEPGTAGGVVYPGLLVICLFALLWLLAGRPLSPVERLMYAANTLAVLAQFAVSGRADDLGLHIASTHLLLIANAVLGYLMFGTLNAAYLSLGSFVVAVLTCTLALTGQRGGALDLTAWRLHLTVGSILLLVYSLAWYRIRYMKVAQQHALLELEASTDPLTGLANRRAGYAAIEALLGEVRAGGAGGLVLLDIDHFKRVNDAHGHPAGDRVLVEAGALLRGALPPGATAGRWGGEEFVLVLPGVDLPGAADLAARLRLDLHGLHPAPGAPGVSASFGVAAAQDGDDLNRLVARADRALYAAKAAGRDCVRLAEVSPAAPGEPPELAAASARR